MKNQNFLKLLDFTPEEIALAENATAATESIHRQVTEDGFSLENVREYTIEAGRPDTIDQEKLYNAYMERVEKYQDKIAK